MDGKAVPMSTTDTARAPPERDEIYFCGRRKAWIARALAHDHFGTVWEFWSAGHHRRSHIIAQALDGTTGVSYGERYWERWEARARAHDKSPWHPEVKNAILEVLGGFPSLRPVAEPAIDRAMERETRVHETHEELRHKRFDPFTRRS